MKVFFGVTCGISLAIGLQFEEFRWVIGYAAINFFACMDYIINKKD